MQSLLLYFYPICWILLIMSRPKQLKKRQQISLTMSEDLVAQLKAESAQANLSLSQWIEDCIKQGLTPNGTGLSEPPHVARQTNVLRTRSEAARLKAASAITSLGKADRKDGAQELMAGRTPTVSPDSLAEVERLREDVRRMSSEYAEMRALLKARGIIEDKPAGG